MVASYDVLILFGYTILAVGYAIKTPIQIISAIHL